MNPTPAIATAPRTLLRLDGRDVLSVLHRISTQRLEDLAAGEARATLFCDFRARLLHRACVARTLDGTVWLARPDAPGAELAAHLDRHVFREDVKVADAGAEWRVLAEYGDADVGVEERDGVPTRIGLGRGETLVIEPREAAAAPGESAETARIESGAPRHGHEIRDDFNPFEVGLARDVHLDKGCFTGQESLMRLMTYESVRRRLVLLELRGAVPESGAKVTLAGDRAGEITSVAAKGPDRAVALAVLRHEACAEGVPLEIEGGAAIMSVRAFPIERPAGLPA